MYIPRSFAESDRDALHGFLERHPLGALVTASSEHGFYATHLPLLLDRGRGAFGVLQGHIARANAHHALAATGDSALVIFSGPDAYVTPSWYPSKQEHGKVVPTWNYIAVHATGVLRFIDDRDFLMAHLDRLTDRHEACAAHADAGAAAVIFARALVHSRRMHNIVVAFTCLRERCGRFTRCVRVSSSAKRTDLAWFDHRRCGPCPGASIRRRARGRTGPLVDWAAGGVGSGGDSVTAGP